MLFLLVGTLALSLLWFLIGRGFFAVAGLRTQPDSGTLEWHVLLGAFVMASSSQVIHFFLPLRSRESAIVVCGIFLLLVLIRHRDTSWVLDQIRQAIRHHPLLTIAFILVAALIGLSAARPCRVEDTGTYHAQILRWAESAKLVPGLALVHGRLGFNSLWFPLEAVLSFAFLSNGPVPLVNTAVFLIGALYLFRQIFEKDRSRLRSTLALAALVPYFVLGFIFAGSQSPDLPALTYGLLAFFAVSQAFESHRTDHYLLAMCLALASVYWKLSAMPLLLFVPVLLWDCLRGSGGRLDRPWAIVGVFLFLSGLILIGRSVVLSGYPLFPSTAFDIFPVDWKAPAWLAHGQEMWIRAWARGLHIGNPQETLNYPLSQWIPLWIENWTNLGRFLMPLLGAGLVVFLFSFLFPVSRVWLVEGNQQVLLSIGTVSLLSSLFWFWQAPDVRFGASYLTALFAFFCLPWLWAMDRVSRARPALGAIVLIMSVAMVAQNVLRTNPVPPWCSAEYARDHPNRFYWLFPAPYPEATFVEERLGDGSIHHVVADGGLAHYGPVPNSPLTIARFAVRRGPLLSDGYRLDVGP